MPALGYPDGQRVQNFTGPELYALNAVSLPTQVQSPALDVSRYAYLSGFMQSQGNIIVAVTVAWYADQALTQLIALRRFALSASIVNPAQLKLANLGPWCQVSFAPVGGTSQISCGLYGSNIPSPLEFTPANSRALSVQNFSIGAGVIDTLWPTDYASGPARLWVNSGGQAATWALIGITTAGGTEYVDQGTMPAGGITSPTVVLPSGAWYIQLQNNSTGNVNMWTVVTPSPTGSI